jgi:hypothetical protein
MKLLPSDPDIKTIIGRIFDDELKLQPDFQRGEVWPDSKKRRLIDSILRNWYVPPIHVIELDNYKTEVLDGQQRLVSIRDFVSNKIKIDGNIEPFDNYIKSLDGMCYKDLNNAVKRNFDGFTIRFIKVTDYKAEEPGELFYRLNQPTNLTSAEQRNAYFGPARDQVKEIVKKFTLLNLGVENLGFSNSRMAYDDVISKLCYTLRLRTFYIKITSNDIANMYRSQDTFDDDIITRVTNTLTIFSKAVKYFNYKCRFNKATLYGWLCFILEFKKSYVYDIEDELLGTFISLFESTRDTLKTRSRQTNFSQDIYLNQRNDQSNNNYQDLKTLYLIFNQKASASSTDVSAVLYRDLIIWIMFYKYVKDNNLSKCFNEQIDEIYLELLNCRDIIEGMDKIISKYSWGMEI